MPHPVPSFHLDVSEGRARLEGELVLDDVGDLRRRLADLPSGAHLDLSEVDRADPSAVATLVRWGADRLEGADEEIRALIDLFGAAPPEEPESSSPPSLLERVGEPVAEALEEAKAAVAFGGELVATAVGALRHPRRVRWVDVLPLVQRTGADGLAIVCLMSGLLGLVTGYQGAVQLERFGASAFTANLVGLAMVRELAPLMTAIVVTGRSGAAFAAEISTMKVSEEIDALVTMGFDRHAFLVVPRCLALTLTLPLLTLVADVAAIFGAMLIVTAVVDSSALTFLIQTRKAVAITDVGAGLLKSLVYAQAIGAIACFHGLRASGGAEGVGRRTTATVVACLVALVAIDTALTMILHQGGI